MMLEDLENALAEHAPAGGELASELPPLTIDGIPVSVDKMTQVSRGALAQVHPVCSNRMPERQRQHDQQRAPSANSCQPVGGCTALCVKVRYILALESSSEGFQVPSDMEFNLCVHNVTCIQAKPPLVLPLGTVKRLRRGGASPPLAYCASASAFPSAPEGAPLVYATLPQLLTHSLDRRQHSVHGTTHPPSPPLPPETCLSPGERGRQSRGRICPLGADVSLCLFFRKL